MSNIHISERSTQQIIEDLDSVWRELQVYIFFRELNNTDANLILRQSFTSKLKHFNPRHSPDSKDIEYVASSLSRGHALIKAALEWESPFAGKDPENSNSNSTARGLQWRLVMTYSGFEIIVKTLMMHSNGCDHGFLDNFIRLCDQENNSYPFERLNTSRVNIKKWIENEENLLHFLKIKHQIKENGEYKYDDAKSIKKWIDNSEEETVYIKSAESVKLAKALRNCTAHGSLSANKVKEWKIENTINYLTQYLAEIGIAALRKLI
ncbi:hypothetical protein [Allocoleopsis franciscana]|uniref:Uncharacterized protein n=1 Tax=Allocoleopsis franciscana PCC 7113 TaxID=1173027 RepID=K9WKR5_9CYAN|nr:hypothetical protein [Allocoleopsis franciscana]AFZ20087.1 hypothetical protein Mic7113_4391 [Allocoleopsis franciscana PCC 7113]